MKILFVLLILLSGCTPQEKTSNIYKEELYLDKLYDDDHTEFSAFDTYLSLTSYDVGSLEAHYDEIYQNIDNMHKSFDPVRLFNQVPYNLAYINSNTSISNLPINEDLEALFSLSLEMAKLSDGYYNPTITPLYQLYQPLYSVYPIEKTSPSNDEVTHAMKCVIPFEQLENHIQINHHSHTLTIIPYDGCDQLSFHFGAIAKGYALDQMMPLFVENQQSYMLNFGRSSITAQGFDSGKSEWSIGFNKPFDLITNYYTLTLKNDFCISTSATDGRYYIDDLSKEVKHHLLNPHTGNSSNDYQSITLVSHQNNAVLDGLSTILFNLEIEDAIAMIHRFEAYYKMDISYLFYNNDRIYLSKNLRDKLTIPQKYKDQIDIKIMED